VIMVSTDKILCLILSWGGESAWLTISNDSVVGNSQTRGSFWARVAGYFNIYQKMEIEKEESQIKSRYYLMMSQKKEFPYTHVWEMVKDEPKWAVQVGAQNASKKTRTSKSGAYTSSSNHGIEENTYEGNESESHPIGQKAAKRKMRGKEKKNATKSVAEEFNHQRKRMEELQSQKLTVLNKIKNKVKEDTLRADYERSS
uniref:No apical meristem-associated C-terminal domain-containing protein n=1 Tax=Kalanchoe fedtschenkoi TaxID=63787 RepID=A0A7N0T0Y7_KALFE